MSNVLTESVGFQDVVRAAAEQLVFVTLDSEAAYVTTPLMYASGACVVVRVSKNGKDFFVSDFGAGLEEAQFLGGETTYRRVARTIAELSGIGFDRFAFFALLVEEAQLPGAIASIANSSQEAVALTTLKIAEKSHRDDGEQLYDRLSAVFSSRFVTKNVPLLGASNTEWHFSSLVKLGRHQVAFEAVSQHPNSVVYAAAKFDDLSRRSDSPGRVAVVKDKKSLKTYLGVLAHSASVIERQVDDSVYQSLLGRAA